MPLKTKTTQMWFKPERVSALAKKAIEAADKAKDEKQRRESHAEANYRAWMSKENFILEAAEEALTEFLDSDGWADEGHHILIDRHCIPDPHNTFSRNALIEVHYVVDDINLMLRTHYKTEYERHPFESWGIYAVYTDLTTYRTTLTRVRTMAELGVWVRHYRPSLIPEKMKHA